MLTLLYVAGHVEAAAQGCHVRRQVGISLWLWPPGLRQLHSLQGSAQEWLCQLRWDRRPQLEPQLRLEQMWLLQLWAEKECWIRCGATKLVHAASTVSESIDSIRRHCLQEVFYSCARGQADSYVVGAVAQFLMAGQLGQHDHRPLWTCAWHRRSKCLILWKIEILFTCHAYHYYAWLPGTCVKPSWCLNSRWAASSMHRLRLGSRQLE